MINAVIGSFRIWSAKPVPKYDYKCPLCNITRELELSMEHDLVRCEDCGAQATRIWSPTAVQFKGSGFYSTDKGK